MSKYTTEVRYICETLYGLNESVGEADVDTILNAVWDKVFTFKFPIFDEEYRKTLCIKILKHYYTREIGFETVGLWKLKLNTKLNEIMPYYNKLYKSELINFNPMYDTDYTRDHKGKGTKNETNTIENGRTKKDTTENTRTTNDTTNNDRTKIDNIETSGNSKTNTTNNETSKDYFHDTPQGSVGDLTTSNYLTNVRQINRNGNGEESSVYSGTENRNGTDTFEETKNGTNNFNEVKDSTDMFNEQNTGDISTTDEYLEHVSGKMGGTDYSDLLLKYRETFLNIDMQIIKELYNLFMLLW